MALRTEFEQPVASGTESDESGDLMPAAGSSSGSDPGQPAVDIKDWGDAPDLKPPAPAGATGD